MGNYHPHGDQSIYDALVRMAQDFSMRVTLADGQGNFGSMDGDPPAAMRYTEVKLTKAAEALLDDLENETVDFQPNYDDKSKEPTVLPARWPNLLVNGAGGIAVGMATNIPTHNLSEVIDACVAYLENPEITIDQLIEHVPGPDFPTGGIIMGRNGIREAYHTGRGSIVMRGRTHIEDMRDREAIIVTEVPYQANKSRMIARMAEVVKEKLIDGISAIRDESNREGVRVVIELKREAMSDVVLNQLFQFTGLQTSFGVNALALNRGQTGTDEPEADHRCFHRVPRRSHHPARRLPAAQDPRAGPQLDGPGGGGRESRCGHRADPARARPADRQGAADRAVLAGGIGDRAHQADRRSGEPGTGGAGLSAVGGAGQGDPRSAPAAPDRPGARQDRRRAARDGGEDHLQPGDPRQPAEAP